jgi:hypothetical protein
MHRGIAAILRDDFFRADVVSQVSVAADLIRRSSVIPAAHRDWTDCVIVLSAKNAPTQSTKDPSRSQRPCGRVTAVINMWDMWDMWDMGHTALLFNPERDVERFA